MKQIAKWLSSILLGLTLMLGLMAGMSATAYADTDPDLWVGGTQVTSTNLTGPGWSFDPATATLTLSNAKISGSHTNSGSAIHANMDLVIKVEGESTVTGSGSPLGVGIYVDNGHSLTISGDGTLTATGGTSGTINTCGVFVIHGTLTVSDGSTLIAAGVAAEVSSRGVWCKDVIVNGTLTATGGKAAGQASYGIHAEGAVTVNVGGELAANGGEAGQNSFGIQTNGAVTVGGTLTANGGEAGIHSYGVATINSGQSVTVSAGGTLSATGGTSTGGGSIGVYTVGPVTVSGTLTATGGTAKGFSYGIWFFPSPDQYYATVSSVGALTATGGTMAVCENVKNVVAGAGWTDKEGTVGGARIAASESVQDVSKYKKVQFPITHSWTYAAGTGEKANTITATCATGCPDGYDTTGITLTLTAPTSLTYDGNAKEATIGGYPESAPDGLAAKPAVIAYYASAGTGSTTTSGGALSGAPKATGNYVAQMTWEGKTASVAFTVSAATIASVALADVDAPVAGKALDTSATTPTAHVTLGTVAWSPSDATAAPATEYTATVRVTADANYAFADDVTAKVNEKTATVKRNQDGTLDISYKFDKTGLEPVTITATDKAVTNSAGGITIPPVGMFTFSEGAGQPTYGVGSAGDTGEGTYDAQTDKLTVTKCGTFTVWAETAATSTHAAGTKTSAKLTVNAADVSYTVTFRVAHGEWDGGGKAEKTVTLTGKEGDSLKLKSDQIPSVGNKPDEGYKAGGWDVAPSTETAITKATTYTYSYAEKTPKSATVTFKVANGSWDDAQGGSDDRTKTIDGFDDDALTLKPSDFPEVGGSPAKGYKAGGWSPEKPTADTVVTGDKTYTYAYVPKGSLNATVTFKVANGQWNDGGKADQTVTLSVEEGGELRLGVGDIPSVGSMPDEGYRAGSWDTVPSAGTKFQNGDAKTYTYAYAPKDSLTATVTFKVAKGSWDDGTTEDKTVTLTGKEGDELRLASDQIPAVGTKPSDGYKAGSWDTVPSAGTKFQNGDAKTYTYAYAPKDSLTATVTFKVVNGEWNDGGKADQTVTLTGKEGDELRLGSNDIPSVGSKPDEGYEAGSWDTVPSAGTKFQDGDAKTYTYAYKKGTTPEGDVEGDVVNETDAPEVSESNINDVAADIAAANAEGADLSGKHVRVWLDSKHVDEGEVPAADREKLLKQAVADGADTDGVVFFDLSLWMQVDGGKARQITDTGGAVVTFRVENPVWAPGKTYYLYHLHDGVAKLVAGPTTERYFVVSTTEFSYFMIASVKTQGHDPMPVPTPTPSPTRPGGSGSYTGTSHGSSYTPSSTPAQTSGAKTSSKVSRVSGADRYATAAAVSAEGFSSSAWAVVATGSNFPDALAASALAGAHNAPIVLTDGGTLSSQAASELRRLGVTDVVVMGGPSAVSDAVASSIESMGIRVTRVSGSDRNETAVEAFRSVRAASRASDTVVVASGAGFADALSIGPWAWSTKSPVLLARSDGTLPQSAVDALKADGGIRRVIIVGGTSAVPDAIRTQLGSAYTYERLGGSDRYETSRLVAAFAAREGMSWSTVGVATGTSFPDALAASALIGKRGGVLLLTDASGTSVANEIRSHASAISRVYVLGGTAAVPASVVEKISAALS